MIFIVILYLLLTIWPCGFDELVELISENQSVAGCDIGNVSCRMQCINGGVCKSKKSNLKLFLIGDSGGLPIYPYTSYAQNIVAKSLAQIGEEENIDFIVSAGDNFYYTGVKDVFDTRFQDSFENVYPGIALQKPWYMIAGNHDHFGNISAQIAYTNRSSRWTYPSSYYKVSYEFGNENDAIVDLLMIDTITLCGNTRDVVEGGFFQMLFAKVDKNPNNPKDPEAAERQLHWIREQLIKSRANYLFVVGHYPIYSTSSHGPIDCLIEKLNPILIEHRVSAYIAGHDHNLQHLVVEHSSNDSSSFKMHYIVSGAASRTDKSKAHVDDVPTDSLKFSYPHGFNPFSQIGFSSGGFVLASLDAKQAILKFYSGKGTSLYQCVIEPRHL